MQCELCGKEATLYKANVEGTILKACKQCASYGKIINEVREVPAVRQPKVQHEETETILKVDENYAQIIRNARERLGLKQDEFARYVSERESLMSKLESGSMKPSIKVARKLEKILKVKLVYEETEKEDLKQAISGKSAAGLTMGDFIKIK